MNPMWEKAQRSGRSAHKLFEWGDLNSAVNRGYYAMLQAAMAALQHAEPALRISKTHAGTIRQFGRHMVLQRGLNPELGRKLTQTEDLRLAADYDNETIGAEEVSTVLADMDLFLAAIAQFLGTDLK